jgi:hypothetical protein
VLCIAFTSIITIEFFSQANMVSAFIGLCAAVDGSCDIELINACSLYTFIAFAESNQKSSDLKNPHKLEDLLTAPVKIADLGNACWTVSNLKNPAIIHVTGCNAAQSVELMWIVLFSPNLSVTSCFA